LLEEGSGEDEEEEEEEVEFAVSAEQDGKLKVEQLKKVSCLFVGHVRALMLHPSRLAQIRLRIVANKFAYGVHRTAALDLLSTCRFSACIYTYVMCSSHVHSATHGEYA
jgi:hypothetical protein